MQDVFVAFWQKDTSFSIHTSIKSYLYTTVRNRSLNYLKSQYAQFDLENEQALQNETESIGALESLKYKELESLINAATHRLPEQCRLTFEMSRHGGFSYKQIADELELSPKTVENQMGIALKKLKESLQLYWELLLIVLILLNVNEWTHFL